ncbi:uncharacterized protein LOC136071845 [Hydra vulgaris]|uniref:Uncharacterized protein LOC136071845 n=1 Tax=Hydra vulgaris TaxID=6087 RepID=A0ABM4BW23_HYDVU
MTFHLFATFLLIMSPVVQSTRMVNKEMNSASEKELAKFLDEIGLDKEASENRREPEPPETGLWKKENVKRQHPETGLWRKTSINYVETEPLKRQPEAVLWKKQPEAVLWKKQPEAVLWKKQPEEVLWKKQYKNLKIQNEDEHHAESKSKIVKQPVLSKRGNQKYLLLENRNFKQTETDKTKEYEEEEASEDENNSILDLVDRKSNEDEDQEGLWR